MRLISFGSSSRAQIVFDNQYVSGYHAELIQLDNGDMLLVDKGSTNGTFVNGNRLTPDKEVRVTRNDTINFANQTLNWQRVPPLQLPDKENIVTIKGVGSHHLNPIHITGSHVSRFHATIKQTKDGKWYICDHSLNGTTINGSRIPKNEYIRIKKGDSIACADTAIANPVTDGGRSNILTTALLALCACVILGLGTFAAIKYWQKPIPTYIPQELYDMYSPTTVLLHTAYYFRIETPKYGVERFIMADNHIAKYDGTNAMHALATGFFISQDGVLVTNLHVTSPWLFGEDKDLLDIIKELYHNAFNIAMADIKVEGAIESIEAVPNGKLFDEANATKLHMIIQSNTTDIDLAILQTIDNQIIPGAKYVNIRNFRDENLPVGEKVYTMGFPVPTLMQDLGAFEKHLTKVLQATGSAGEITMNNDKYNYGFNATSYQGASGSPIFDEHGKLIGIASKRVIGTQGYNFAIRVKYLKRLLNKARE